MLALPASAPPNSREREFDDCDDTAGPVPALGFSDEGIDLFGRGSRHDFPGERRSDLWYKLARSSLSLSGAVLSSGMARLRDRLGGRRLHCLENRPGSQGSPLAAGDACRNIHRNGTGSTSVTPGGKDSLICGEGFYDPAGSAKLTAEGTRSVRRCSGSGRTGSRSRRWRCSR